MTKPIIFALVLTFCFATSSAVAVAGAVDTDPASIAGIARIAHKLQLTSQQRRQIRAMHDNVRKTNIRLRAEIEAIGIDLRRELDQDMPSETKVGSYISKISQLEGKARQSRVVSWIRIRKLLNVRQRKMLALFNAGKSAWATRVRGRVIDPFGSRPATTKPSSVLRNPFANANGHAKKHGRLTLRTRSKTRAKIYVDGTFVGTAPVSMRLEPGRRNIKAIAPDGTVKNSSIVVKAGRTMMLTLRM